MKTFLLFIAFLVVLALSMTAGALVLDAPELLGRALRHLVDPIVLLVLFGLFSLVRRVLAR